VSPELRKPPRNAELGERREAGAVAGIVAFDRIQQPEVPFLDEIVKLVIGVQSRVPPPMLLSDLVHEIGVANDKPVTQTGAHRGGTNEEVVYFFSICFIILVMPILPFFMPGFLSDSVLPFFV
jgi:hypothetical protein